MPSFLFSNRCINMSHLLQQNMSFWILYITLFSKLFVTHCSLYFTFNLLQYKAKNNTFMNFSCKICRKVFFSSENEKKKRIGNFSCLKIFSGCIIKGIFLSKMITRFAANILCIIIKMLINFAESILDK